jgi:hypothetical protein
MYNLGDHDRARHALARQVLDEAERRGLRVWQQFGAAYIARPVQGRLVPAPKHWQRVVEALSYEIACVLDWDCGWGCTVERVPGGKCLIYRPERWHSQPPEPSMPDDERMSAVILASARHPSAERKSPTVRRSPS